jgi:hypothetical protein
MTACSCATWCTLLTLGVIYRHILHHRCQRPILRHQCLIVSTLSYLPILQHQNMICLSQVLQLIGHQNACRVRKLFLDASAEDCAADLAVEGGERIV